MTIISDVQSMNEKKSIRSDQILKNSQVDLTLWIKHGKFSNEPAEVDSTNVFIT